MKKDDAVHANGGFFKVMSSHCLVNYQLRLRLFTVFADDIDLFSHQTGIKSRKKCDLRSCANTVRMFLTCETKS